MYCIEQSALDYFNDSREPVGVIDGKTLEVVGRTDTPVSRLTTTYQGKCYRIEPIKGSAWAKMVESIIQQTCTECGHVGNVASDCKMWACAKCELIQSVVA